MYYFLVRQKGIPFRQKIYETGEIYDQTYRFLETKARSRRREQC